SILSSSRSRTPLGTDADGNPLNTCRGNRTARCDGAGTLPSQRLLHTTSLPHGCSIPTSMNIVSPTPLPDWVPHVPVPVNLRRLFLQASFVGCGDIRTVAATDSSALCRPGCLFAAIKGTRADGHQYIREAIQN